jgi:site-specific recombinase XerD
MDQKDSAMAINVVKTALEWDYLLAQFHTECEALCMERGAAFYRDRLNQFYKWVMTVGISPGDFKGHDLTKYLDYRRKAGISQATIAHDAKSVRKLFEFAKRTRHLPVDPVRDYKVRAAKRPHTVMPSNAQLDSLLKAIEESWTPTSCPSVRFRSSTERTFYMRSHQAIIAGLIATGCRINEILSLKKDDYDPRQMRIAVVEGKGGESRYVYFSKTWKTYVDNWLKVRPRFVGDRGYLFINQYGGRLDYSRFRRSYDRYRKRAGMENVKLHGLRHHAVTTLAQTDPLMAQQQAGHKNLSTTMIYVHAAQEHNRAKYAEADPLAKVVVNKRTEKAKREKVPMIRQK